MLQETGISTAGLHSKRWDQFAGPDAPQMGLIINAADEIYAVRPGHPATARWGYADPSALPGTEAQRLDAFRHTLTAIRQRLTLLIKLPAQQLVPASLQQTARELAGAHDA